MPCAGSWRRGLTPAEVDAVLEHERFHLESLDPSEVMPAAVEPQVAANGSVVTASEQENEDLFWAIRGGGANFGIVTEFELCLHELGPTVLAGLALWPLERGREVLGAWRDCVGAAPDELSTACVVITAPSEPFVPDHLKNRQ